MKRDINNSPAIGVWALALGAVGFASGFFGPIELNPDANQDRCSASSSPDRAA